MATLDSTSTFADARAEYKDNLSYRAESSPAKASAFITACMFIIGELPKQSSDGQTEIEHELAIYERQIKDAEQWLAQHDSSGGTSGGSKHYSFSNFRD